MNRRRLLVAGALVVIVILALRRQSRREAVEIGIEEPDAPERASTDDGVQTVELEPVALETVDGIGPAYAKRLREAGVEDLSDLVARDPDDLARESGIAEGRIRTWIERARDRDEV